MCPQIGFNEEALKKKIPQTEKVEQNYVDGNEMLWLGERNNAC
jgi:hypothetical protein